MDNKAEQVSKVGQSNVPSITLPKGGGAIRGIGEKFAANPVTGTGSMTVPIATSPGRSGFGPQLSLSYNSGSGNGPFGFGWSLSIPSITRKTDKGLPQYFDTMGSDEFILSGAEDLVQVLGKGDKPLTQQRDGYLIQFYRPRLEGLFARIEWWTNLSDSTDVFWRSISKDNIATWYGKSKNSRIADPANPSHIFSWLICESHDDKGNVIIYCYKEENSERIFEDANSQVVTKAYENNRSDTSRSTNRYLKRIRYGNRTPYFPESVVATPPSESDQWLFELVFDYGDHHLDVPTPTEKTKWPCRNDPFSSYRAGFEVRTYRLCRRVLMFHHFLAELGSDDYLVHSTEFDYEESSTAAFITSIIQSGYVRQPNRRYLKKSMPQLEFKYSKVPSPQELVSLPVEKIDTENLPIGLDGSFYQWTSLNRNGLSGILTEQNHAWSYKQNAPEYDEVGAHAIPKFESLELVLAKPSISNLASGQQLMDVDGDGDLELVTYKRPSPGFYERASNGTWEKFTPFRYLPNINWDDPNLRFIDLNNDSFADVLVTENKVFTWYPSMAGEGFSPSRKVYIPDDGEKPRLVFADGTQSMYLADMSGDGLTDLVSISENEICYFPNLGYGKFGDKVIMGNPPEFDYPSKFNQKYIRLADIDGSGTTDIIYLGKNQIDIYFNQAGNSWSQKHTITGFPRIDNLVSVNVVDLFSNGTTCLVWSSPVLKDSCHPMYYINLMGSSLWFSLDDIRDFPSLVDKLWNQSDPVSRFIFDQCSAETQSLLENHADSAGLRATIVKELNQNN